MPDVFEPDAERCRRCGGSLLDGNIAMPVLGGLRFVLRVGTGEAATEVAAQMCAQCGEVTLRGRDPARIVQAQRAAKLGKTSPQWRVPRKAAPPDDDAPGD